MNKVLELQKKYLEEIDKYSHIENRDEDIAWEKIHMASCGRIARLLKSRKTGSPG